MKKVFFLIISVITLSLFGCVAQENVQVQRGSRAFVTKGDSLLFLFKDDSTVIRSTKTLVLESDSAIKVNSDFILPTDNPLNTAFTTIKVSYENDERGIYKVRIPFKCMVQSIYWYCISATNSYTYLYMRDNDSNLFHGQGINPKIDRDVEYYRSSIPNNNLFEEGDLLEIQTAGASQGKLLVSLEFKRLE